MSPVAPSPDPAWPLQLIVGLGNPGEHYRRTRHNLGFHVLDALATRVGVAWHTEARWTAEVARWNQLWLLKPLTFMNRSGEAVAPFARYHHVPPDRMLVVSDDLALPVGRLRLRGRGSAGGQNGLASVLQHVGTTEVPRLRVGIGRPPPPVDAAAYVLSAPANEETPALAKAVEVAVETILIILHKGLDAAINHANTHRFSCHT